MEGTSQLNPVNVDMLMQASGQGRVQTGGLQRDISPVDRDSHRKRHTLLSRVQDAEKRQDIKVERSYSKARSVRKQKRAKKRAAKKEQDALISSLQKQVEE